MNSTFTKIETDVEKFFKATETSAEKFGVEFVKLFKKAPSALQTVDNFVMEAAPIIEGAVALADPVAEAPVAAALAIAERGLAALSASAQSANSGTSVLDNLQNFATSVPALLTGIAIKNPALEAKIGGIVNLITNEAKVLMPAVEAWVKQIEAAASPAPGSAAVAA